ncbi:Retrotransposable element Tf2 [Senna tora]|uniref:Retrotransposable element Tf2 n=1 Tax=Senna tora TaxID=362788 RepID=A0A834VX14_9FABA|nr:Retrotransposable element Tf2 [Senna tora]
MREMADAMKQQADAADRMLQHIQGDIELEMGTNFSNKRPMNFSKGGSSKGMKPMVRHYARDCPQNMQTSEGAKPPTKGRVFTLKGEEATESDDLIEGTGGPKLL